MVLWDEAVTFEEFWQFLGGEESLSEMANNLLAFESTNNWTDESGGGSLVWTGDIEDKDFQDANFYITPSKFRSPWIHHLTHRLLTQTAKDFQYEDPHWYASGSVDATAPFTASLRFWRRRAARPGNAH